MEQEIQQCSPQECQSTQMQVQPGDMDFDITRTFMVLTATLVIPVYLSLSVVAYSIGALI
jgi:hypothetical protein